MHRSKEVVIAFGLIYLLCKSVSKRKQKINIFAFLNLLFATRLMNLFAITPYPFGVIAFLPLRGMRKHLYPFTPSPAVPVPIAPVPLYPYAPKVQGVRGKGDARTPYPLHLRCIGVQVLSHTPKG